MEKKETILSVLQEIRGDLKEIKVVLRPEDHSEGKQEPLIIVPPKDRFIIENGVVIDTHRKKMWVRMPHTDLPEQFKKEFDYEEREAMCRRLTFGGYSDWQQPGREDLESMRDFSRFNPCVNTEIFPDIKPAWYGTGEKVQGNPDLVWAVSFGGGSVDSDFRDGRVYVWPVRPSQ
jgi:hypothetical protein